MAEGFLNGDVATAMRIERVEATNHVEFVSAVGRLSPDLGAASLAVGSGTAVFAGSGNPLTQAFALGFDGPVDEAQLDVLFEFYESRGVDVAVEACNLAHPSLANGLIARGCKVDEHTHVLGKLLTGQGHEPQSVENVRRIGEDDLESWCDVVTKGFTGGTAEPVLSDVLRYFYEQENSECFAAWRGGQMVGGGSVFFVDDTALLAGTSTIPEARGRGVQRDLLRARLDLAVERGAKLAVIATSPGTTSQRNALRAGFSILYARTRFVGPPR